MSEQPPVGEIVLYRTEDGRTRLECRFVDETLWLTQALMAELFQKDIRTVNEHLRNAYVEGELEPGATIRRFRIVRQEGRLGSVVVAIGRCLPPERPDGGAHLLALGGAVRAGSQQTIAPRRG